MTSIFDGILISTCSAAFAGISRKSSAVVSQMNCFLNCPLQRSREWIDEVSDFMITSFTLDFCAPLILINRQRWRPLLMGAVFQSSLHSPYSTMIAVIYLTIRQRVAQGLTNLTAFGIVCACSGESRTTG